MNLEVIALMADKTTGELLTVNVSDLPPAADIYDDFKMPGEFQGDAVHVTGAQMKRYSQVAVQPQVDKAASSAISAANSARDSQNAAEGADNAKTAAQNALVGIENAIKNIPAGATLIVNDLTTGGTSAALSAEMGKTLGKRTANNLLHNWYFANCVNSRGFTKFFGTGYMIDRWHIRRADGSGDFNCTVTLTEDGIRIVNESGDRTAFFAQYIEGAMPIGKHTLSAKVEAFSGTVRIAAYKGSSYVARMQINNTGINSFSTDESFDTFRIAVSAKSSVTISAVKLEYGDVQTLGHLEGGEWVLNEIPSYGEELAKCRESKADVEDYFANGFHIKQEGTYASINPSVADEMVAVARSYYEKDAEHYNATKVHLFGYDQGSTCFDSGFGTTEGNHLDCSAFIGLVLRGVPDEKSPYPLPFADRARWDTEGALVSSDYSWAVDPYEWEFPGDSGKSNIRTASAICQWMMSRGCSVDFKGDFSNVEPGDIVFYASRKDGDWAKPDRFMHISHVAICATKEESSELAGYPFKHQIYDSAIIGDTPAASGMPYTFDYTVASGNIVSNRYLENTNTGSVIAVCRPSNIVRQICEGGTGATNAVAARLNLGAASRRNLADNSNFLNPVNQRGKTKYIDTGYTVDRWQVTSASGSGTFSCTTTVNDDGITVANAITSKGAFLRQLFEKTLPAGTYTLSALVRDVTGTVYLGLYDTGGKPYDNRVQVTAPGLVSKTVTVAADTQKSFRFNVFADSSVTVSAVKLERGDAQTLAHKDTLGNWVLDDIPDYAEELWKCQRYYQLFSTADKRPTDLVDYRPSMLKEPTLGTVEIDGVTYYSAEANP